MKTTWTQSSIYHLNAILMFFIFKLMFAYIEEWFKGNGTLLLQKKEKSIE